MSCTLKPYLVVPSCKQVYSKPCNINAVTLFCLQNLIFKYCFLGILSVFIRYPADVVVFFLYKVCQPACIFTWQPFHQSFVYLSYILLFKITAKYICSLFILSVDHYTVYRLVKSVYYSYITVPSQMFL